ncbi:MAG: META domain-containing protein [Alphaproteobacteria bacterium]|nr:META domain-containing protein [Alphaproteobacteria bacterium]
MNMKVIATVCSVLALAACGNNSQNPEKLKGANFVATSGTTEITLSFDENEMRANGQVVNLYNAPYTADGDNIKFGNIASTMMMGPTEAMQVEQEYFQFMATVEKYNLSGNQLTLKNADGAEMVFTQVTDTVVETVAETETVVE